MIMSFLKHEEVSLSKMDLIFLKVFLPGKGFYLLHTEEEIITVTSNKENASCG